MVSNINEDNNLNNLEENNKKVLNVLGLATRARKLSFGYDTVGQMLGTRKVFFVLVASDASSATKERFINKCGFYNIPINLSFESDELSKAVGKNNAKVVAVCDQGFSKNLNKLLKDGVNYES